VAAAARCAYQAERVVMPDPDRHVLPPPWDALLLGWLGWWVAEACLRRGGVWGSGDGA
jgi:hypothetical protein